MNSQELLQQEQFDILVEDVLGCRNGINVSKDQESQVDNFLDINESWCNENTRRSFPPRSQQIIKFNSLTCNASKKSSLVDLTIDNSDKDESARMQQLDVIVEDDKLVHSGSNND